jgi:hypothetical protein
MSEPVLVKVVTPSIAVGTEGPQLPSLIKVSMPGPAGPVGPEGPSIDQIVQALCAVNVKAGQPVYLDRVTGQVKLAEANIYAASFVSGLASADTNAGHICTLDAVALELPDWTLVVGVTALTPGLPYFLSTTPGMLTTTAPQGIGQCVTLVGIAATTTIMNLNLAWPLLL